MLTIQSNQQTFTQHISWSKAYKEVKDYGNSSGQTDTFKQICKSIRRLPEKNLHIKHKYCKKDKLVKTEFRFINNGLKDLYVKTDNKTTNPVEFTFNLLKGLLNPKSEIYNRIYNY